jgi:hypothetical protein
MLRAGSAIDRSVGSPPVLNRCIGLSVALHCAVALYGGVAPQQHAAETSKALRVSLRAAPEAVSSATAVRTTRQPTTTSIAARHSAGPRAMVDASAPAEAALPAGARAFEDPLLQRRAPHEDPPVALTRFDPAEYLTPAEVDRVALPANEDLFDILPLSGFQPGYWLVRLFVDQDGVVRELQVVDSRGAERNTEELRIILLNSRFMPARLGAGMVKSQKMVEFSFEPGPAPVLSASGPIPSEAER